MRMLAIGALLLSATGFFAVLRAPDVQATSLCELHSHCWANFRRCQATHHYPGGTEACAYQRRSCTFRCVRLPLTG
jgi:hypothetical protein